MTDQPQTGVDEILAEPLVAEAVREVRDAVLGASRFAGEIALEVRRERIREVCAAFRRAGFTYLADITAVDYSKYPGWTGDRFAVVYHLYDPSGPGRVRLRIRLGDGVTVPSVTPVWKSANWPERETFDMFGIVFEGHPNLERILMWEGFNGFPLRKDFPVRGIETGARIYPEVFPEGGGPKEGSTGKEESDVNVWHGAWPAYGVAPVDSPPALAALPPAAVESPATPTLEDERRAARDLTGAVEALRGPVTPRAGAAGTMLDVEEMEVNFGPQHPSTHGVLRVVVKIDGERIVEAKPVIGYLHRGTEKLFEKMNYPLCVPHTDRMDYIAAATNNLGYVEAVEKLMGIRDQIPRRAHIIRVMLAELQRISSHLLWLATHAIDLGAMTPFFYAFREREEVLDLFEEYCGARLTLNCMKIGSQPYDVTPRWLEKLEAFLAKFGAAVDEYESLLTNNRIWKRRTVGIGVLSAEDAIDLGVTGPPLRASGVDWDLRKKMPYAIYDELDFEVPLGRTGDTFDRYLVRMEEMRQSARILGQCIPKVRETPEGDLKAKISRVIRPPEGEVYHAIEGPKGELGYYVVSDGKSQSAYRIHVRPPSFNNLQALPVLAKGHLVSDLVALIGTIDIVLGEVDR